MPTSPERHRLQKKEDEKSSAAREGKGVTKGRKQGRSDQQYVTEEAVMCVCGGLMIGHSQSLLTFVQTSSPFLPAARLHFQAAYAPGHAHTG